MLPDNKTIVSPIYTNTKLDFCSENWRSKFNMKEFLSELQKQSNINKYNVLSHKKKKILVLNMVKTIINNCEERTKKEECDVKRKNAYTSITPKGLIATSKLTLLNQKLYIPYSFIDDDCITNSFPVRTVPKQIYLHFVGKKDDRVNINKFIMELSHKIIKSKVRELVILIPKEYNYGTNKPNALEAENYINAFFPYKFEIEYMINFFKENLSNRDVTLD